MVSKYIISFFLFAGAVLVSSRYTPKIVGGEDALPHEFPYQISLQWNYNEAYKPTKHMCGGSILDEYHVLTAGHCYVKYSEDGHFEVVAGAHDLTAAAATKENEQRRLVESFTVHESYDGDVGPDDLAIIRVKEPFVLDEYVQTVSLPEHLEEFEGKAMLSGWGSISNSWSQEYPDTLQKANLPLHSYEECSEFYDASTPLAESNICAGEPDGSSSGCSGDSGGPLVAQIEGRSVQIGVVSWGAIPCGQRSRPTVFVAVSHYIDWINGKLMK
ncbi:trypsin-1-like [Uranotaenia lowii]|uniref:trypsin-1-like n=1 Tax=Uranotaenia lowii TaxID=190385 RepID=UPI00247AE807|nr:trypsin-1-like [Uranotaenia lowii]